MALKGTKFVGAGYIYGMIDAGNPLQNRDFAYQPPYKVSIYIIHLV